MSRPCTRQAMSNPALVGRQRLAPERGVDASPEFEVIAQGERGSDAVRIARQQHPDILLMDLNMPEQRSIDAAREITAIRPSVKTVMLTSCDGPQPVRQVPASPSSRG